MIKHRTTFICWRCGNPYARAKGRAGKFCSYTCSKTGPRKSLSDSFFKRVIKKQGECWGWIGSKDKDGYGVFNRRNYFYPGEQRASRISWLIHKGPIANGLMVLHNCDNPECTNPEHLFLGDAMDNNQDMVRKGRAVYLHGQESPNSKLTEKQVLEIRRRASEEGRGIQRRLAKELGVGFKAISKIVNRQRWAHV